MASSTTSRLVPRFAYITDNRATTALAFIGGAVDGLGWWGLFQIFVGSITGNIVVGTAAIVPGVGGYASRLVVTAAFIVANMIGHAVAYWVTKVSGKPLRRTLGILLVFEAAAMCVAWFVGAYLEHRRELQHIDKPAVALVAALYAISMGFQNAAVLETCDGFPSTTVVTMTLCKVGAALADCILLYSAANGLLPPPASTAAGKSRAERMAAASVLFDKACALLGKLICPLLAFALGALTGVWLQYRIGFHSTAVPLGVLLVLVVGALVPHPDEIVVTIGSLLAATPTGGGQLSSTESIEVVTAGSGGANTLPMSHVSPYGQIEKVAILDAASFQYRNW